MRFDRTPRRVLAPTDLDLEPAGVRTFRDVPGAAKIAATTHFEVFVDTALGRRGLAIAQFVLGECERDYESLREYFGGATLPGLPIRVVVARMPEDARAYHYEGCLDLYCDAQTTPAVEPRYTEFLLMTQIAELFMEALGRGWRSDSSEGEALSRVLAASLYPKQIAGFSTAAAWLDSAREDFVNRGDAADGHARAVGCGTMFLNYLHYQLGFDWQAIVSAGGATLAQTFQRLTGDASDPFPPFASLVVSRWPIGTRSQVTTDNVFPLAPKLRAAAAAPPAKPERVVEFGSRPRDGATAVQTSVVVETVDAVVTELYSPAAGLRHSEDSL